MNLYPKTWKLRALIRAAYIFEDRFTGKPMDRLWLKILVKNNNYINPILKQAQKRVNQGKTIKLP